MRALLTGLLLALAFPASAQEWLNGSDGLGIERCTQVAKGGDAGSFSAVCTYDIAYNPKQNDALYYVGLGSHVVAVDGHGDETPIYEALGRVVGVADVRGTLYVVARNDAGAHDYVFRLFPAPSGQVRRASEGTILAAGWGYDWLWRGCETLNCDDGDHADQVFSTQDGSWGWRDRQGGWLGCGTVDVWDWIDRAPDVRTLRECVP